MINILKSESGNIAIAMLLVVIGAMSGLTMSSIAFRDTMATMAELEDIQCIHFLRTEASRGEAYLKVAAKATSKKHTKCNPLLIKYIKSWSQKL